MSPSVNIVCSKNLSGSCIGILSGYISGARKYRRFIIIEIFIHSLFQVLSKSHDVIARDYCIDIGDMFFIAPCLANLCDISFQ